MYDLVEIFESLQGEGRNMGRPCVFIRFAGCNLKCPWCDTEVARRFAASTREILDELKQYKAKSVILTGGEPTIQAEMPELVAALKGAGLWIGVETNGLRAPAWLDAVDYVACSPKAESADRYRAATALRRCDEVRLVASAEEAVFRFAQEIRARIAATRSLCPAWPIRLSFSPGSLSRQYSSSTSVRFQTYL